MAEHDTAGKHGLIISVVLLAHRLASLVPSHPWFQISSPKLLGWLTTRASQLPHDNTNKLTFVPSELKSSWASAQSDQSLRCSHGETLVPQLPTECTAKTDQTGQMPRLIWVLSGRIDHFVDSVLRQFIYGSLKQTFSGSAMRMRQWMRAQSAWEDGTVGVAFILMRF